MRLDPLREVARLSEFQARRFGRPREHWLHCCPSSRWPEPVLLREANLLQPQTIPKFVQLLSRLMRTGIGHARLLGSEGMLDSGRQKVLGQVRLSAPTEMEHAVFDERT